MAGHKPTLRRSQSPPADLHTRQLPLLTLTVPLYRIHRASNHPIFFGKTAENRFDDPAASTGQFGVLYAALDDHGAFIETFGESDGNVVSLDSLNLRSLSVLTVTPLKVVDLTASGAAWIGAAGEITAGEHALSQQWAKQLWAHPEKADGVYYRARHDQSKFSVALFDRSNSAINVQSTVPLLDTSFQARLAEILNEYRFGIL